MFAADAHHALSSYQLNGVSDWKPRWTNPLKKKKIEKYDLTRKLKIKEIEKDSIPTHYCHYAINISYLISRIITLLRIRHNDFSRRRLRLIIRIDLKGVCVLVNGCLVG